MSPATNKAIIRRFIDQVLNQKQFGLFEEFLLEDVAFHRTGPDIAAVPFTWWAEAFPDGQFTIEDCIAEADRVAVRAIFTGTILADLPGIAETGRRVSVPGIAIFRLVNARIAEARLVNDDLGMLNQLGVIPPPLKKAIQSIFQPSKGENK